MHKIDIPAEIVARARRIRGRDHILETIDVARTAHLIVDLQNGFVAEGAAVEVPVAREIVPNVNRISAGLRAGGGSTCFYATPTTPPSRKSGPRGSAPIWRRMSARA